MKKPKPGKRFIPYGGRQAIVTEVIKDAHGIAIKFKMAPRVGYPTIRGCMSLELFNECRNKYKGILR